MADDNVPQYPFMFAPSEWANKFSNYKGSALPWPPSYSGVPTDALGNPIQSYLDWQKANPPGTTITTTPTAAQPRGYVPDAWALLTPQQRIAATNAVNPDPTSAAFANAWLNTGAGSQPTNPFIGGGGGGGGLLSSTYSSAGASPNNWQAVLSALSNPGKVTTPGVYNYPSVTAQPDSASMDSIIASLRANAMASPAPAGIGGGSSGLTYSPNTSFLNTLAALRAGSPGAK